MRATRADRGRVQIAVDVDLRASDEPRVDVAALEESHEVDRAGAPHGLRDVGVVTHRVEELRRGLVADDAQLEEADRGRGVRALRDHERDERQAHPHEDPLAVADLARRPRDHDLAGRDVAHRRTSTKINSGPWSTKPAFATIGPDVVGSATIAA